MERVIETTTSTRQGMVGSELSYITYENEEIPELILRLIRHQNNSYPFLALLYHEAKKASNILELGIGPGRSTKAMLLGCKHGGGHLWSIDWGTDPSVSIAIREIEKMGVSQCFTWIRKNAEKIPVKWYEQNKADLIWIDIDSANYPLVVGLCIAAMHKDSKLFLHNINVGRGEKGTIRKYASRPGFDYEEINLGHGLGILTKTRD